MSQYLSNKEAKQFTLDPDMISAKFCVETGKLENPGVCSETELGWYSRDNLPSICDGEHEGAESSEPVSSEASSEPPRVSSSETTQSGPVVVPSSSAESSEPASSENEQSSARRIPIVPRITSRPIKKLSQEYQYRDKKESSLC